jgi:hypothetical protein
LAKPLLLDDEGVRVRLARKFSSNHRKWFTGNGQWPLAIPLGLPTERQSNDRLAPVRHWVEQWRDWQGEGEVVWVERQWPQLGTQILPERLLLRSPLQVALWLGEGERWLRACRRRQQLVGRWPHTKARLEGLYDVLADYSDADFRRLLAVVEWLMANADSGLFVRQLPIPGVDSKWIEHRKGLILDLLDPEREPAAHQDFYMTTGIRREPSLLRCRLLDVRLRQRVAGIGDISAPIDEIAALDLPIERVFIVENLRTGLAFADLPGTLLVMRLGYAVDLFKTIRWLKDLPCWYWGDIDTHGFAILNRLRHYLPTAQSLLMDEATLRDHLDLCGVEEKQVDATNLDRLNATEARVCRGLIDNRWGNRLRLEQERIAWPYAWQQIIEL